MNETTLEASPAEINVTAPTLNGHDRCDNCGSQAYVHVTLPMGEILFCAHHATKYLPKLTLLENVVIHDERHKLSDKRLDVSA